YVINPLAQLKLALIKIPLHTDEPINNDIDKCGTEVIAPITPPDVGVPRANLQVNCLSLNL
ncbi:hypothetical protein CSKR_201858, partial [Clonorchis sinensis]